MFRIGSLSIGSISIHLNGNTGVSQVATTEYSASAGTPAIRINQATDAGTILMSFKPAAYGDDTGLDVGEPVCRAWNFALSAPNTGFAGDGERPDRIFAFGYNVGVGAGGTPTPQEESSDASCGWTIEDYYNNSGTQRHFEFYVHSCPAGDDGSGQVRPIFATIQYATLASSGSAKYGVVLECTADEGIEFNVGSDTWQWHTSTAGGLDTECLVSAGSGIVFANNSRSLKAKLSSGTAKDIAYINSSDNLVLAEGGIVAASVGALLKCDYGMQTMYSTGASIADSNFTGNGSETPANGAFAFTNNGGTFKLWARFGGAWKSVALT